MNSNAFFVAIYCMKNKSDIKKINKVVDRRSGLSYYITCRWEKATTIFGGDALRGNTRSHSEHDG